MPVHGVSVVWLPTIVNAHRLEVLRLFLSTFGYGPCEIKDGDDGVGKGGPD